jgi:formylglycine-generating enzyme required for sulfatase activity
MPVSSDGAYGQGLRLGNIGEEEAMSDIFLSYASEDREQVRVLVEALTQQGWSVFWDRNIPVGRTWQEVLEEELETAGCLVVVWSENSIKRKWLIEEANEAVRRRVPISPVLIDAVLPPLEFRSKQTVNLATWDGGTDSFAFQDLVRSIRKILGRPGIPKPVKPEAQEIPEPEPTAAPLAGVQKDLESPLARALTNSLGMQFVLIPAGTFLMGSGSEEEGDEDEQPRHQVTISQPFYLQITPVTQGQWQRVMGENPSYFQECGEDCPVENVSWNDAQEFIKKLNRLEKTDRYRLPTEAEWEYACRAGNTQSYCFGDGEAELGQYAWYADNSQKSTHPVGRLKPNAWGLYDMHGNVYEWCQDWYGEYPSGPVSDPKGPSAGEYRVLRGGSWDGEAGDVRSAYRLRLTPGYRYGHEGFRVARDF